MATLYIGNSPKPPQSHYSFGTCRKLPIFHHHEPIQLDTGICRLLPVFAGIKAEYGLVLLTYMLESYQSPLFIVTVLPVSTHLQKGREKVGKR